MEKAYKASTLEQDEQIVGPEFWWIDDLVEEIVISDHICGNNTITVRWKDGTETTVPSKAKRPWEAPAGEAKEGDDPELRSPKTVRKIKATH